MYRRKNRERKTGGKVTRELLEKRASRCMAAGFPKQKWVIFCETLLNAGYRLRLYEAVYTNSKYITVEKEGKPPFKVRFSDHKPIKFREARQDCDFFVGVTNFGVTTTADALKAVYSHFLENEVTAI